MSGSRRDRRRAWRLIGAAGVSLIEQLATINAQGVFRISSAVICCRGCRKFRRRRRVARGAGCRRSRACSLACCPPGSCRASASFRRSARAARCISRSDPRPDGTRRVSAGARHGAPVGAGLLLNSFISLSRVEKGYDPANVVAFQLVLPPTTPPIERQPRLNAAGGVAQPAEVEHAGFAYAGICSDSRTRSASSFRQDALRKR